MRTSALPLLRLTVVAALLAALSGCGGSDSTSTLNGSGSTSGTGNSSTPVIDMGSGTGSSFQSGTLQLGVTSLSAGGSTTVTANLVDTSASDSAYTTSTDVTFTSTCSNQNLASLTSPVTTTTGTAISTYVAKGCSGSDTITAVATVNGKTLTATADIAIQAAALGSITFESATPTDIALKGMGGSGSQETSTVKFIVKDETGGIVQNKNVTFTLSSSVGGITLSPKTAKTDANGEAQTVVQSGTVATPVSIIATIQGTSGPISTQSSLLTIHSGIPTQNSFSLSGTLNVESFDIDGQTDDLTVRLADRFGNPVPDGTPVTFIDREPGRGGNISPSCTTTGGACTVTWTSQNPRPSTTSLSHVGHAYILAYAIGEESFTDNNGDGVYDLKPGLSDTFTDIGEPYADSNENGKYDSGETYFDFNKNGVHDGTDKLWEGINCKAGSKCGSLDHAAVYGQFCIVMSTSAATISGPSGFQTVGAGIGLTYTVTDTNGNDMAGGTTVQLVQTGVANVDVTDPGLPYTYPDIGCGHSGGVSFGITVVPTPGATSPPTGTLQLKVTSPSGLITLGPVVSLQ